MPKPLRDHIENATIGHWLRAQLLPMRHFVIRWVRLLGSGHLSLEVSRFRREARDRRWICTHFQSENNIYWLFETGITISWPIRNRRGSTPGFASMMSLTPTLYRFPSFWYVSPASIVCVVESPITAFRSPSDLVWEEPEAAGRESAAGSRSDTRFFQSLRFLECRSCLDGQGSHTLLHRGDVLFNLIGHSPHAGFYR